MVKLLTHGHFTNDWVLRLGRLTNQPTNGHGRQFDLLEGLLVQHGSTGRFQLLSSTAGQAVLPVPSVEASMKAGQLLVRVSHS